MTIENNKSCFNLVAGKISKILFFIFFIFVVNVNAGNNIDNYIADTQPTESQGFDENLVFSNIERQIVAEELSENDEIVSRQRRIINPLRTEPLGSLFLEINKENQFGVGSCTGSMLSDRVILTAAHCFVTRGTDIHTVPKRDKLHQIVSISLWFGLEEKDMKDYFSSTVNQASNQQLIHFDSRDIRHFGINNLVKLNRHWFRSLYDKKLYSLKHGDIAMIILPKSRKIDLSRLKMSPVHLFAPKWHTLPPKDQLRSEWYIQGRNATVVGYGRTDVDEVSKKGLGKNYFTIRDNGYCTNHIRKIGWVNDEDLMNIQDVFSATGMHLPYATQVCSGDSGGPLFIEAKFIILRDRTLLYEITKNVQLGITIWVDSKCKANFNGFIQISKYLPWIEDTLGPDLFSEINSRIYPSEENVLLYGKYKDLIDDWRLKTRKEKTGVADSFDFDTVDSYSDGQLQESI